MNPSTRMKRIFLSGTFITVAGIVLRFSARSLVSTEMGSGWWSVDESAEKQLQQDARLIMIFGLGLILLACHRWLWLPESSVDASGITE